MYFLSISHFKIKTFLAKVLMLHGQNVKIVLITGLR